MPETEPMDVPDVEPDDEPIPQPAEPEPAPDVAPEQPARATQSSDDEHPRCWDCGWTLHTALVGDLFCVHWPCAQYHRVVGTLVADRAVHDRLREAIEMANGEQQSEREQRGQRAQPAQRPEPPQH